MYNSKIHFLLFYYLQNIFFLQKVQEVETFPELWKKRFANSTEKKYKMAKVQSTRSLICGKLYD